MSRCKPRAKRWVPPRDGHLTNIEEKATRIYCESQWMQYNPDGQVMRSVALWKYFKNCFLFKKQFPDSLNKLVYSETRICKKPKPYYLLKIMANLQNIWLSENYLFGSIKRYDMLCLAAFPPSFWVVEDHINGHKIFTQKVKKPVGINSQ